MTSKIKQLGFTLIELTVALGLIIVLSTAAVQYYDSNRSRAETLFQKMTETAGGLLRMKTDASCFPTKLAGMVNPADASDTFCGIQSSNNWKGPYTAVGTRYGQDAGNTKDLVLDQISPSLSVYLEERVISANTSGGPSNESKAWILSTRGLTSEIQKHFLDVCSKADVAAGAKPVSRCFPEPDDQVGYLVDANAGWEQYYAALITPAVVADPCKGASCTVVTNDVPVVVEVDPCIVGGVNVCVLDKCPDGSWKPASGVCPVDTCPDGSLKPASGICIVYCPDGTVKPASGVCPVKVYCPDGVTVKPASGICSPPPCRVGIDAACTKIVTTSSSSSSSSSSQQGFVGSDGQVYAHQSDVPGIDTPCSNCRITGDTDENKASWEQGRVDSGLSGNSLLGALNSIANAIAGAIGGLINGIISFINNIINPPPPSTGGSSSGGGNNSSNSGQHADGTGGESGNNTGTTGHSGGCSSSGC